MRTGSGPVAPVPAGFLPGTSSAHQDVVRASVAPGPSFRRKYDLSSAPARRRPRGEVRCQLPEPGSLTAPFSSRPLPHEPDGGASIGSVSRYLPSRRVAPGTSAGARARRPPGRHSWCAAGEDQARDLTPDLRSRRSAFPRTAARARHAPAFHRARWCVPVTCGLMIPTDTGPRRRAHARGEHVTTPWIRWSSCRHREAAFAAPEATVKQRSSSTRMCTRLGSRS